MAAMLRADLADARRLWLRASQRPDERANREESLFLNPKNEAGASLDFHALRHTCGAWLAMRGVQPKVIQSVMRHCSITLTMDTYGHLMEGAEAAAIQANADIPLSRKCWQRPAQMACLHPVLEGASHALHNWMRNRARKMRRRAKAK